MPVQTSFLLLQYIQYVINMISFGKVLVSYLGEIKSDQDGNYEGPEEQQ